MTVQQRMAAEQGFRNQNIALAQKAFSDYVQLQQLEVSKGTLTNSQADTNLKYWQAQHPELAPNARVDTLAYRTLQELAPVIRGGNATQEQIDQYNNAAVKYQEFKEVQDPVSKQLKSVPTRPLPDGYPVPAGSGAGGVRTLTEGLSPSQQQVERDPAAYKVSESQYDRDSKEIAAIGDAGRQSRRIRSASTKCRTCCRSSISGRGTEASDCRRSVVLQLWAPAALTGWQKESANLSGSQAAEAFSKLALVGAGSQERSVLGARGGYQAIKLFKEANPNINLQDATNKSILDMQLVSNQANADYSQAALSHFADNETKFSQTHQYKSLAQFDRDWNGQRNPQVYSAAMGAISGQQASQWAKGLSDDEYTRALQIVQRAKPSAVVQTKSGPYSMQPNAVTTGTSAKPGDHDHSLRPQRASDPAMIQAQLPGGVTLQFPDGTPDAIVQGAVKQHLSQQPDAASQTPESKLGLTPAPALPPASDEDQVGGSVEGFYVPSGPVASPDPKAVEATKQATRSVLGLPDQITPGTAQPDQCPHTGRACPAGGKGRVAGCANPATARQRTAGHARLWAWCEPAAGHAR